MERDSDQRSSAAEPSDIQLFVAALPKVDLHLHLVGSASPETVAKLAGRHPDGGVPTDVIALRDSFRFTSFSHFIEVYTSVNTLITNGSDLTALVVGLAADLAADHVPYAEVTVTPTTHLRNGIDAAELAEALTIGRQDAARGYGVELAWIFDISGDLGAESGMATVDWVLRHQPPGTVGFGLGGPEPGVPRASFRQAFDLARSAGLHSVPHAGETVGPNEVWSALQELAAERIGHGIQSARDASLLRYLADRGVPLEVCPTSNVCTGAVSSLAAHPLPDLVAAGVPVAIGSDDPGMFGTSLSREYLSCHRVFGASRGELADLARSAVRAAFCTEDLRRTLLREIDAVERGEGR